MSESNAIDISETENLFFLNIRPLEKNRAWRTYHTPAIQPTRLIRSRNEGSNPENSSRNPDMTETCRQNQPGNPRAIDAGKTGTEVLTGN